jgi:hypothetical protein
LYPTEEKPAVISTHGNPEQQNLVTEFESHLQTDGRVKNGTYTLVSNKTGAHRTLRISTVMNKKSGLYGKRILSLLIGPDNQSDYIGFAFVNDDNSIKVWGAYRCTLTQNIGVSLVALLTRGRVGLDGSVTAEGISGHVLFKSACCVCNRPLTDPESIRSGIGPVCAGR